ncbi:MAG: hypothetical protein HY696_07875 [Deltaproteobacteria bacterium]|nr:hypothetical protein [Deltaproteobacteria bacterium]
MSRVAVIINGDREPRHVENVERAAARLRDGGYEVLVVSPERPDGVDGDHYWAPNQAALDAVRARLVATVSADDTVLLYTTGHGTENGLVLPDATVSGERLAGLVSGLAYRERTVIMDQCFSGNLATRFAGDPRTLFASAGSLNETVCCDRFAPFLWAPDAEIPDLNADGVRTWQERLAYAASKVVGSVPRFFVGGLHYIDDGIAEAEATQPAFDGAVIAVSDEAGLKGALARLRPGEVAVVDFSATWCNPCQDYKPTFAALARADGGRRLFIRVESTDAAWMAAYGVTQYPTVMLYGDGYFHRVTDIDHPLAELSALAAPTIVSTDIPWILDRAVATPTDPLLPYALQTHLAAFQPSHHAALAAVLAKHPPLLEILTRVLTEQPQHFRAFLPLLLELARHNDKAATFLLTSTWKLEPSPYLATDVPLLIQAASAASEFPKPSLTLALKQLAATQPAFFNEAQLPAILQLRAGRNEYWTAELLLMLLTRTSWTPTPEHFALVRDVFASNGNLGRAIIACWQSRPELRPTLVPLLAAGMGQRPDYMPDLVAVVHSEPALLAPVLAALRPENPLGAGLGAIRLLADLFPMESRAIPHVTAFVQSPIGAQIWERDPTMPTSFAMLVAASPYFPWAAERLETVLRTPGFKITLDIMPHLIRLAPRYPKIGWAIMGHLNRRAKDRIMMSFENELTALLAVAPHAASAGMALETLARRQPHLFGRQHIAPLEAAATQQKAARLALDCLRTTRPALFAKHANLLE